MKRLSILGATGSIGVNTLDIVTQYPERYSVTALTGGSNLERLAQQVLAFRPLLVAVARESDVPALRERLGSFPVEILHGAQGLSECAAHPDTDMVVSAIVGAAGLVPTMAAIEAGKDIALANKETLVTAGPVVMESARARGVAIYPVDSEHSAIFQSLEGHRDEDVRRLILTASGGPFLHHSLEALAGVTPEDALAHPNWDMGRKISIDSATMMNKGLEVIEARWLFDLPPERIAVHIHPQSIVHSMVEYVDGSVIAQLGIPDMRTPIAYALSYPERLPLELPPLDLCALGQLTFMEPDTLRFPCLKLAFEVLEAGGRAPAVLNAANEVAVESFLARRIGFSDIPRVIAETLDKVGVGALETLAEAIEADRAGREAAADVVGRLSREACA